MSRNYWKVVLDGVSLRGTQSKKLDAKKYHEELGKKKCSEISEKWYLNGEIHDILETEKVIIKNIKIRCY